MFSSSFCILLLVVLDTLGEPIGQGAYSKVYKLIRRTDNKVFAVKQIANELAQDDENEIRLLQNFNSPFIVQYVESFKDDHYLYIVMEFCENGNLRDYINKAIQMGFMCSEDVCYQSTFLLALPSFFNDRKHGNS